MLNKLPYQKLEIWKKAMALAKLVFLATKAFPKEQLFVLVPQMQRAALSVAGNIAEGSQRTTKKDFTNFLAISLGSLVELETQIILSFSLEYLPKDVYQEQMREIDALKKMIYVFSQRMK